MGTDHVTIVRSNRQRRALVTLALLNGTSQQVELIAAASVSMRKLATRAMAKVGAEPAFGMGYSWQLVAVRPFDSAGGRGDHQVTTEREEPP